MSLLGSSASKGRLKAEKVSLWISNQAPEHLLEDRKWQALDGSMDVRSEHRLLYPGRNPIKFLEMERSKRLQYNCENGDFPKASPGILQTINHGWGPVGNIMIS